MTMTLFRTPVIRTLFRWFSITYLWVFGWECVGERSTGDNKCIVLGVPHTSNWDFVIIVAIASKLNLNIYWMGKQQLFRGPIGWVAKWLGGIPIDRSKTNNVVDQMVDVFNEAKDLWLLIAPEGTRKRVPRWKTGFYHIAKEGQIPIVLSFIDYVEKRCGLGETFRTTDDMKADLTFLQAHYGQYAAKHPEDYDPVYKPKD